MSIRFRSEREHRAGEVPQTTLRAGSSAVAFAVVCIVLFALLADVVVRGDVPLAVRFTGVGALVVWVAWMLLVRPSIRVQPDRAVVVNLGRITEVPWGRIVDIRRRLQLILDLDDGHSVEAWGSPFPKRRLVGKTAQSDEDDPSASVLRSAWRSGAEQSGGAAVVRRPDVLALSIGVAALVVAAVSVGVSA